MQNKLFSIITVVYNAKNDLEKTVESIQNQSFQSFEHIIIDGKSNDGTVDYLKSLKYENIKYISEKDNGIYDAMNKGIGLSSAKYLIFLNAADTFTSKNILEEVFFYIKENKPKVIIGGNNVFSEEGKFLSSIKPFELNKKNLNRYATRVVCHQSIFVYKDVVKLYDTKYRLKGELNWYYDLIKNLNSNEILKLDNIICNYYLGGTGDTNFFENYFERINVSKKHNSLLTFILTIPYFLIPIIFRIRRRLFGK